MFLAIGDEDKVNKKDPNDGSNGVMLDSKRYPKHPFKVGWISDEYNFDDNLECIVGKGFSYIFQMPSWIYQGEISPMYFPNWQKAKARAVFVYKEFIKECKNNPASIKNILWMSEYSTSIEFLEQGLSILIETIDYVLKSGRPKRFDLLVLDGV